jgi:hypothetical protein
MQPNMPLAPPNIPTILTSCAVAQDSIDAILPQLFTPGSQRGQSVSTDNQMNKALRKDNFPLALQYMRQLIDLTLKSYYANPSQITGGRSASSTRRVEDLLSGLYCVNGLGLIHPSIDASGTAAIVTPGTAATVGIPDPATPGKNIAATVIQANDLPGTTPVLVTIAPIPGPLDTPLDQYGPFFEFNVTPSVTFVNPVLTGACINTTGVPAAVQNRLRLAHNHNPSLPVAPGNNQFGNIEIIAPVSLGNLSLSCDPLPSQVAFMDRLKNGVKSLFLPDPLYAGTTGTGGAGGKVTNYSPYGAVDPLLTLSANPATTSATAGVPVSTPPSVTVKTDSGFPVSGVNVGFATTVGSGTVAPATASTNGTGVAAATSWTLAVGANTVVATPSQGGLSFAPANVSFTATGLAPTAPFSWSATGWNWKLLTTYPTVPSETDILNQAVNSATGYSGPAQAAFSVGGGCPIYNATTINSADFGISTVVAFRRDFVMPGGAATGTMYFAIDNDFKVFVNGVNLTSSVTIVSGSTGIYPSGIEAGFMNHDGCANRGDFTLSLTGLSAVSNTVVIVALDRGVATYFDASVTPPSEP